jgi:excisionase family DNA binding protein
MTQTLTTVDHAGQSEYMPGMDSDLPDGMTIEDVAKRLSVSTRTVRRLIDAEELETYRLSPQLIRVTRESYEAYLERIRSGRKTTEPE